MKVNIRPEKCVRVILSPEIRSPRGTESRSLPDSVSPRCFLTLMRIVDIILRRKSLQRGMVTGILRR
ncbi:MAG: hypothetical protein Q4C47_05960 [Planctomycetia bacterium]|nr:hypothetical protein [Planctomycetia bacterium]